MRDVYFSQRLLHKMNKMPLARITLVEGGSGYGKTTAVREALSGCVTVCWHTAAPDNASSNYATLYRLIAEFCPAAACALMETGLPNRANADTVSAALCDIRCSQPAYLVLDNFQNFLPALPQSILSVLLNMPDQNLHVVMIAYDLHRCVKALAEPADALRISQDDLLLRRDEIMEYYAQFSIPLLKEQAELLACRSDGWMVALSLDVRRTLEAGLLNEEEFNIHALLTSLIWNQLNKEDQDKLIVYSFFETLTVEQICELEGTAAPDELSRLLLGRLPLVRFNESLQQYEFHALLHEYLVDQTVQLSSARTRTACGRAGEWCAKHGDTVRAITCYHRCGDYGAILSLDLVGLFQVKIDGKPFEQIAEHIADSAPEAVIAQYPISMLRIAYYLFGSCRFDVFGALMQNIRRVIDSSCDTMLLGEWMLIDALSVFPDIERMGARYQEAARLIGGRCKVISPLEPYMFGCPSMWMLFYAHSGDMERNAGLLTDMLAIYTALTGGHGRGADEIYRGECHCVQARFEEAEICAYKAMYLADAAQQVTVSYGAAMLLGIIAVYRGDDAGLHKAVELLETKASHYTKLHDTPQNTCMLETVRGYLMGLMLLIQRYPAWVRDDGDAQMDLTFVNFLVYQSRVTDLVLKKKYRHALACIEALLGCDQRLCSAATRNFMLAGLALCYLATGHVGRAVDALDASLTLAAPDHNYTFHARLRKVFAVLFTHPRIAGKHKRAILEIKALKIDYAAQDDELVFSAIQPTKLPAILTAREREMATLASAGMRNREIAQAMGITEATVKSHLNTVFQKLNIDRRSKIVEMLEMDEK